MVEKRVKKFGQGPPLFRQCPKEIDFFPGRCSLSVLHNTSLCSPQSCFQYLVQISKKWKWHKVPFVTSPLANYQEKQLQFVKYHTT